MYYLKKYNTFNELQLNEKLMRINKDVDLIYNIYFKKDYDKINKTRRIDDSMFKYNVTDTSILNSNICKIAHNINPCKIYINKSVSNNYNPYYNEINLTVNNNAINFAMDYDGFIDIAAKKFSN